MFLKFKAVSFVNRMVIVNKSVSWEGDRYLEHLSKEENEMLDVIAEIIAEYILRKSDEVNAERNR